MKKVYLINAEYEECTYDKPKIDLVMPRTALHYITDGYGYFNGIKLGKGDFFCAVENQKVCYYPDRKIMWKYYYFDLSGDDIGEIIDKYGFLNDNAYGKFNFLEEIKELKKLFKIYDRKNIQNEAFLNNLALTLLSLHNDYLNKCANLTFTSMRVKKIKEYMERNFNKKITVEDISKSFFLSRAYFRNIFFKSEGISPKKYLQKLRMEKAAELLENTDYKVSEISVSVGYDDQLAFSKAFKGYFGVSPVSYRTKNNLIR